MSILGRGWRRAARCAALEERLELGDRAELPRRRPVALERVPSRDLLGQDGTLELTEGAERNLAPVVARDDPEILVRPARSIRSAHLELVTAVRAADRRAPPADESVVELVLRLAALALNVHRFGRLLGTPDALAQVLVLAPSPRASPECKAVR